MLLRRSFYLNIYMFTIGGIRYNAISVVARREGHRRYLSVCAGVRLLHICALPEARWLAIGAYFLLFFA